MALPGLGERSLFNPAAPARPRAPRPYQSERTRALTDDQMNDLLEVVKALAETGSIIGMRDYALTLLYFFTGLRRNEVTGSARQGSGIQGRWHLDHSLQEKGREVYQPGSPASAVSSGVAGLPGSWG